MLKNYWHIGFAADTPNGLMVPVIRDADKKGVLEIAKEMGDLAKLARDGKLKPDQMQGGTFTISSLGGIGGIYFTPIINAPEVAIMGVCKSYWKQYSSDGKTSAGAHAAAVAVVGPPRDRRRRRRALQRAFRQPARRHAARAVLRGRREHGQLVEVKVPDIGDFKDVAVIEVLVKPGETIGPRTADHGRVRQGHDGDPVAASPASVKEIKVKVGDKVSEGSCCSLDAEGAAAARPRRRRAERRRAAPQPRPPPPSAAAPAAPRRTRIPSAATLQRQGRHRMRDARARRRARRLLGRVPRADLGMKTVLVERYATLGGVCLNVGCIPSKALLHTAAVMDEVKTLADHGIAYGAPKIDLDKLRGFKDGVVKKLTGGLAGMAKARKVEVVTRRRPLPRPASPRGRGHEGTARRRPARRRSCKFAKAIIAAGSQAVKLPFMPEDQRVVDSTGALLLQVHPEAHAGRRRRHHRARDGAPSIRRSARASTSSRCSTA